MKLHEYDIVELTENISDVLVAGTVGVIMLALDDEGGAFEVEFFDADKSTICFESVEASKIRLVARGS